ncbi:MAG TPA: hypothetical protein VM711_08750, partial [Sphingomicrobium sp.]|nr:hypothetical protein [Sphingomicrobium sp.]
LASAGLIWDFQGWHADLEGRYVGSQNLQSAFSALPIAPGELEPGQNTKNPHYFLANVGVIKVIPLSAGKALRLAFHVDNLFNKHYFSSTQVNIKNVLDMSGNNQQLEDFYGLAGEPRAVFGSASIYF